jgi:hypothetical protein
MRNSRLFTIIVDLCISNCFKLGEYECYSKEHLKNFKLTAPIRFMTLDSKGERLALLFEKDDSLAYLYVALFSVRRIPFVDITPIGLVKGPLSNDETPIYPICISFAFYYEKGSLLGIVSKNVIEKMK